MIHITEGIRSTRAWELTWLVIGLGALLTALVVSAATALALRPRRTAIPASPEALETTHLTLY